MGTCFPVPHIFQRSPLPMGRASSAPVPGTVRDAQLLQGQYYLQGKHYALPGMVPLPTNVAESEEAAEVLGQELVRALQKTGVPLTRPLLENLTINFGIGLANDPAVARMMVETISRDHWDN